MNNEKLIALMDIEYKIHLLRLEIENESKLRATYAKEYIELIEEIPECLPGGTGGFSPLGWVKWAKSQLGYEKK